MPEYGIILLWIIHERILSCWICWLFMLMDINFILYALWDWLQGLTIRINIAQVCAKHYNCFFIAIVYTLIYAINPIVACDNYNGCWNTCIPFQLSFVAFDLKKNLIWTFLSYPSYLILSHLFLLNNRVWVADVAAPDRFVSLVRRLCIISFTNRCWLLLGHG